MCASTYLHAHTLTRTHAPARTHTHTHAHAGVVHLVGGMAALIGSIAVGPRVGRFDAPGSTGEVSAQLYRATAAPQLYLMGTLLL